MTAEELMPIVQTGGAIACLALAVRWLADRFTSAQRELVDLLRGIIADNTKVLGEVRAVVKECHTARDKARLYALTEPPLQERP